TTVVPPGAANAGTMNSMLFPPPVGITATMGLSPRWMARMAGSWTPRNHMVGRPIMRCAAASRSIIAN
ncbi:uncharacterized protein P174DRAFT_346030, partial [Aspergillus novofumigatus IBT 16806]